MLRSVFVKYMLCFLLIFTVSFLVLYLIIIGMFAVNERTNGVENAIETSKMLIEQDYTNYIAKNGANNFESYLFDKNNDVLHGISAVSNYTNTLICIVEPFGKTMLCNKDSIVEGKTLNISIIDEVYQSRDKEIYQFSGDLGGLLDGEHYIKGVELYTGDSHGVLFVCSPLGRLSPFMKGLLNTMTSVIVLVLIAGMIGCYFISERITTPLRNMSRAAQSFSRGNFDVRVEVRGNDEISELTRTMNSMADSLAELEKLRSDFLANVSHDLRTPMTTISGFIDGILDGVIPEEKHEYYLKIVASEVRRLSRLVTVLLDISRIQAGERRFNIVSFDVCEVARRILISNENRINEKGLDVEFECDCDNMYIKGDSDSIHQVLYNLVDNAIKFSYKHGRLVISIRENSDETVSVSVFNSGEGIANEDLKYIFDRFYKVDKSRGLDKGGVGLGLYISKAIVQAQNGSIHAESKYGEWCRFVFTMPSANDVEEGHVPRLSPDIY